MEIYRVRWVINGNTIQVKTSANAISKIRLAGLVALPVNEPLGETSKKVVERFLPRGIEIQVLVIGRDPENCEVAEVYVGDELINEKLVRLGLALVCPRQIDQTSQKDRILEAEEFARNNCMGIHASKDCSHLSDHYYIRGKSVTITNRVPQVCREKGLTTAYQLAMRCGIKRTTAYRLWDHPEAYPTRKTMMKLCDGLGVQPEKILFLI